MLKVLVVESQNLNSKIKTPEIQEELKVVSSLSYKFYKNVNEGMHSKMVILYLFLLKVGWTCQRLIHFGPCFWWVQLDLKEISFQQGSGSQPPSTNKTDIILLEVFNSFS